MAEIVFLGGRTELVPRAAEWFSKNWGVPVSAYLESMAVMSPERAVPRWYAAMEKGRIIGGIGVIENDFHDRTDLSPNVCAVFVEESFRRQGIARKMLEIVCGDMHENGIDTLYLLTDHDGFYERCGWSHLTYANENGGGRAKVYIHIYEDK